MPLGNAVNHDSAGPGEAAPGIQSRTAPVVEDRQREHVAARIAPFHAQAAAERGPLRAVPLGNVVNHYAASGGELAPGIESRTASVVEDRQRRHIRKLTDHSTAERGPLNAVPPGDIVRRRAAGGAKVSAGIQSRTGAIVENPQHGDSEVHSAADRGPLRTVPLGKVVRRHTAGGGKVASGVQSWA